MSSPFQKLSVQVLLILITHILGSLTVFDIKTVNTEGVEEPSVTAMFAAVAEWLVFVVVQVTKTSQQNQKLHRKETYFVL